MSTPYMMSATNLLLQLRSGYLANKLNQAVGRNEVEIGNPVLGHVMTIAAAIRAANFSKDTIGPE